MHHGEGEPYLYYLTTFTITVKVNHTYIIWWPSPSRWRWAIPILFDDLHHLAKGESYLYYFTTFTMWVKVNHTYIIWWSSPSLGVGEPYLYYLMIFTIPRWRWTIPILFDDLHHPSVKVNHTYIIWWSSPSLGEGEPYLHITLLLERSPNILVKVARVNFSVESE